MSTFLYAKIKLEVFIWEDVKVEIIDNGQMNNG